MIETTMLREILEDQQHRFLNNNAVIRSAPDWGFVATSFALTTLSTTFCLGSAIFLVYYRKNSIISLSQPRFLGVAFLASALVAASGYFLLGAHLGGTTNKDDKRLTVACSLCVWGFVVGHNIVYMAYFGKLWRIQKVCRVRRHQTITVRQTIWPLRLTVAINICILVAWAIVDPPVYLELEKGDGLVGTCDYIQPAFFIPIQILLGVSACLGLWMTHKTKNLPSDLNDGGQIANVYIGNIIAMMGTVTMYWVGVFLQDPTLINIGISLALSLTSITSVAPIALPKMYYIWYQKKHNKLPEGVGVIGQGSVHITGRTSITIHANNNRRNSLERPRMIATAQQQEQQQQQQQQQQDSTLPMGSSDPIEVDDNKDTSTLIDVTNSSGGEQD